MRERPIIFSAPMVRAILEGRKTQTRRVVKFRDHAGKQALFPLRQYRGAHGYLTDTGGDVSDGAPLGGFLDIINRDKSEGWAPWCPYGGRRDRLWVRETYAPGADHWGAFARRMGSDSCGPDPKIFYAADGGERPFIERWRPSIHMPRFASRVTLEITDVRVQRLHDITEEDARAEGASADDGDCEFPWMPCPVKGEHLPTARCGFLALWNSINGRDAWEANPFVWALTFSRVEPSA